MSTVDDYGDVMARGRADPVWFIETMLGVTLWPVQRRIVEATFHNNQVAVKACHASGKSFVAACIVLAFFYLYPYSKVLTTAPTQKQVEKVLWAEIHNLSGRLPKGMGGKLLSVELRGDADWWAIGLSTNDPVRFQGHHAKRILVILDEGPGVDPSIWEAIHGLQASGDVHLLVLGNPTEASGPFYDAFTSKRASWTLLTIDAADTPNMDGVTVEELVRWERDDPRLGEVKLFYLTSRRWVWQMWQDCGCDELNPMWQSRVRGAFPEQASDALIPLSWLERAKHADPVFEGKPRRAGIDVAGPGEDETACYVHESGNIVAFRSWPQADPRGEVAAFLQEQTPALERVRVDSAGLGYYFERYLHDQKLPTVGVNVGSASSDSDKYVNLKAELYWGLRIWFQENSVAGLTDERTLAQLAGVRYHHDPRGRVVIESKDEAKKRGVSSPDRAEALMLALSNAGSHGWIEWAKQQADKLAAAKNSITGGVATSG